GAPIGPAIWKAVGATALLVAITLLCLAARRKRPYLIAGWSWFVLTLLPVIGIVQVGYQWHADRFTYVPAIGLAILVAWSVRDLLASRPALRLPGVAAAALVLVALTCAS